MGVLSAPMGSMGVLSAPIGVYEDLWGSSVLLWGLWGSSVLVLGCWGGERLYGGPEHCYAILKEQTPPLPPHQSLLRPPPAISL